MNTDKHMDDCICAWCQVERENAEMIAEKPTHTEATLPATDCSDSWFMNGAEYRERDGWIEARNHLNPKWITVDKSENTHEQLIRRRMRRPC